MIRCIVTGAGAPGIKGTLFSLRNNYDNENVYIVGIDISENALGQHLVDQFYKVPRPEDEDYIDTILEICKKEKIEIIIPQTTREIEFYSKNQDTFNAKNIKVLVASREAISISNNKYETLKIFESSNLEVGKYYLINSRETFEEKFLELSDFGKKPVVVKAPVSNGMRGLRILINRPWDLERFFNEKPSGVEIDKEDFLKMVGDSQWPELLLCEYLPGAEYSVDAFIGEKYEIAIPRERVQIRSGISFVTKIDMAQKEMIEQTLIAAKKMGLKGVFGFQFKLDVEGKAKVLECNPRIQGTMVASVMAGQNVIWMAVKELLGTPITYNSKKIEDGLVFRRTWGGLSCTTDGILEI